MYSLYGYAFQYADKKYNDGLYTGKNVGESDPESLNRYLEAVDHVQDLDFKVYVPVGFVDVGQPPCLILRKQGNRLRYSPRSFLMKFGEFSYNHWISIGWKRG